MAKILLNVEIDKLGLQKTQEEINKAFTTKPNGGFGGAKTQLDNLQKSTANLLNTIKGAEKGFASGLFEGVKKATQSALKDIKELNEEIGDEKPTDEQKKRFAELKKTVSEAGAAFATLRAESQKLQKENKLAIPNVDNLRKKYANLLTTIQGTEKYYKKGTFSSLTDEIKKNLTSLQQLDPTTADYAVRVNELDKQLNQLSAQFAETRASSKNMHGSVMEIAKGFAKFQLAARLVMKPLQMIREAWADLNETLVETEDAVVSLRRVAGQAANANELYELAQRYGQTFENVSEIATNFARAGYDWIETIKATEAALLALNTAELDATEASDGMIAILQQFGYEASNLESIIDKLNITADNAAVSTDGLLKALSRTGSSAKNANLSLEETVAVVTALSEATGRSGENIGTALNSLIQFSTKASALDTFAKLGGDVEKTVELYRQGGAGVLDIWEELSKVISNSQTAENILGEGFTTEEFEALNEELKQALGENFAQTTEIYDTASTFRKNYFIALLQNLDQVQESLDTMQQSQGYSQKENQQYLDTYTAKVNTLQAKWQDIANDEHGLLAVKKALVDSAIVLLEIFDALGGIQSLVFGISGALISGGWGALIGVAFGAINSHLYDYTKSQEAARELAISTWEANKKNSNALEELYAKYQKLTPADDEFLSIQKELVSALGDKAIALEGLTIGSEEYTKAVEKMTEAELELYRQQQRQAANASKQKVNALDLYSGEWRSGQDAWGNIYWYTYDRDATFGGNPIERYANISKIVNEANEEYNRLIREGKFEEANKIIEGKDPRYAYYKQDVAALAKGKEVINQFIQSNTAKLLSDYEISTGKRVETNEEFDSALQWIIGQFGIDEFYNEDIKSALSSFVRFKNGTSGGGGSTDKTNLSDVVNELKAIRDNTEKTKEIEEKQLALQEARNQRTVRVFNAETGQWEMQANEKDIAKAEEDLKDTAWNNVLDYLSTEEAQEKLNKGEFTLPSFIAEMLAKPNSDDAFQSYLASVGILSGAVNKSPMSSGAMYNNSATTNNNNSNTYNYNGIPISSEMANNYTVAQLAEMFGQME